MAVVVKLPRSSFAQHGTAVSGVSRDPKQPAT